MGFDQDTDKVLGTFQKPLPGDGFQIIDCLGQYDV